MPIGRLVQRFRWRRIVDKTVRYRWFPGHCKPSSRSLFVCKSPGNFLVIRVFVYVVHPAFLWVILGLACRGVCAGCIRYRFSRRPSLRPSLVFRLHASLPPSFVRWRRLFLRTRRAHLPFVRLGPPFVSFPPSFVRWRRFFLCTRRTHLPLVRHRSSVRVVPFLVRTVASVFPFARVAPSLFRTASVLRSRRSLPLSYGSVFRSRFLFVVFFPCSPFIFRFFAPPLCLCFY